MKTYKIPTTVNITERRIRDMLTAAFEGGCNHWLRLRVRDLERLEKQHKTTRDVITLIMAGATVPIYDAEGQDGHLGDLNMLGILSALSAMGQGENIKEEKNERLNQR